MSTSRHVLSTDRFRRDRAAPFVRAAMSFLIAHATGGFADRVAKQRWPGDSDTALAVKAATSPTTSAIGLAGTAVSDVFTAMGGASAAAIVLGQGLELTFEGATVISAPGVVTDANIASFVGEAMPIPVKGLSFDGPTLARSKFATIIGFTRQQIEHSNIEAIVRAVVLESLGLAADAALFSTAAASSIRPAGLLNGISPLTASTATDPQDAMIADIKALVSAVAPIAGNGEVVLVAAIDQAVALRLRQHRETYVILVSAALAAGTIIAVAPNGLASAIDPVPRFEVADAATLVMDDAAGPLSQVGTPNTISAPARSMFQTDSLALRVVLQVGWGLRSPTAIAFMTGVAW